MSKLHVGLAGLLAISAGTVHAAGLERSPFSPAVIYEDGRYLELSAGFVLPSLSGQGGIIPPPFGSGEAITGSTGDLLSSYAALGAAYKADINDRLSYALILNQPLGASTDYPGPFAPPFDATAVYGGSFADLTSFALTGLLAYDVTPRVKVFGGPVLQTLEASAALPFIPAGAAGTGYEVATDRSWGVGAVLGASYEIPDIALRVGLTYETRIGHDLDTTETLGGVAVFDSQTPIDVPQSLTLDFRTGIAKDTLIFGQVRWVDWSEFDISPPNYPPLAVGRPLVDYSEDWITYTLGVGRRFNENWVGAVSVIYEPPSNTELTSLGPVDGRIGVTVGATYETETYKISGGINYSRLGDTFNVLQTDYDGGDALGVGIRFGWKL